MGADNNPQSSRQNDKNPVAASVKRKIAILGVLLFIGGFAAGVLFSLYGLRSILFRYRPSPARMAEKLAGNIQRDLGLPPEMREKLIEQNLRHFNAVTDEFDSMRGRMDLIMKNYAGDVAKIIDDPVKRERWLATYRTYFPPGPPPGPPGRHGPPPPPPPP